MATFYAFNNFYYVRSYFDQPFEHRLTSTMTKFAVEATLAISYILLFDAWRRGRERRANIALLDDTYLRRY